MHAFTRFSEISEEDKAKFLPLLLLGDESEAMIERYIHRGRLFALYTHDNAVSDLCAVCVLTHEGDGVFEIKNLAVVPKQQRRGFGGKWSFLSVNSAVSLALRRFLSAPGAIRKSFPSMKNADL